MKAFLRRRWLLLAVICAFLLPVSCIVAAIAWAVLNPMGPTGIRSFPMYSGATEVTVTETNPNQLITVTPGQKFVEPNSYLQYKVQAAPQAIYSYYENWLLPRGWHSYSGPTPKGTASIPHVYDETWKVQHVYAGGFNVNMPSDLLWILSNAPSFVHVAEEEGSQHVNLSAWYADPNTSYVGIRLQNR